MRLSLKAIPLILIISILLLSTGCKTSNNTASKRIVFIYEDFDKFYIKFHTDSVFQLSRVQFPLQGQKIDGDSAQNWSKENWSPLKTMIFDIDTSVYKTEYEKTDDSFYEQVWLPESGFVFECRFKIINKKWYLVYVMDSNL